LYSSQSDECAQKKAGLYSSQSDECAQKKAGLYSSQSDECAPQTRILLYRQSRCAKCAVLNPEGGEHSADFQQQSGHYLNEYQAPRPAPCFSKYPFFTRFFM